MSTSLPAPVRAALETALDQVSRSDLAQRSQRITQSYRSGGSSVVIRSELDALAYAVARMPATFAAIHAALQAAAEAAPNFAPASLIDIGAGPGTASFAAQATWPSLSRVRLVDANGPLLALARRFAAAQGGEFEFAEGELPQVLAGTAAADLVLAGYCLTEIPPPRLAALLDALWHVTGQMLVIVEPGTPAGFARLLACRAHLLARGGHVLAPCSHLLECPLQASARWCHFQQRVQRSRDHRMTKGATVPFEDEKFGYLVLGKGLVRQGRSQRILATPRVEKGQVTLELCAPGTVDTRKVERRNAAAYKAARGLDWGGLA